MEDQLYEEIVHFHSVSVGKYPERIIRTDPKTRNCAKSNFRQTANRYHVVDGVLMYGGLEVLAKSRLAGVMRSFHDNPATGGHFGRDKTYDKIRARFFWRGMRVYISKYIKSCEKCFGINPKMSGEAPPLHPITVPTKAWSLVAIDLIGPLQETTNGNKYIVAITDHFTKYSEAAAIPDKTAECVGIFLFNTICRHGCMDTIISDQGTEFNNKLLNELLALLYS